MSRDLRVVVGVGLVRRRRRASRGRARRPGTARPGAGRRRPGAAVAYARCSSAVPSSSPGVADARSSRRGRRRRGCRPSRCGGSRPRSCQRVLRRCTSSSRSAIRSSAVDGLAARRTPSLLVGQRLLARRAPQVRLQHVRVRRVDRRPPRPACRTDRRGAARGTGRAGRPARPASRASRRRGGPPARPAATSRRACPDSRSARPRRASRCRCRARARSWRRRRAARRPRAPLDLAAVLRPGSRRGRRWIRRAPRRVARRSRRVNSASSSAARRDRVNPIVRTPSSTSCVISHDASVSALRRAPVSSSMIGGFHSAKSLSPARRRVGVDHLERRGRSAVSRARRGCRPWRSPGTSAGRRRSARPAVAAAAAPSPRATRTRRGSTCASSTTTSESRKQEVGPPRVVGEQRQVQHVRVRQHEVRVLPDQRPLGLRRVAVVDGRSDLRQLERAHRAQLVARERLRREQVQRGRLRRR